jgi:hypothetical protein
MTLVLITLAAVEIAILSRLLQRMLSNGPRVLVREVARAAPPSTRFRIVENASPAFIPPCTVVLPPAADHVAVLHEVGHAIDWARGGWVLRARVRWQSHMAVASTVGLAACVCGAPLGCYLLPVACLGFLVLTTEANASLEAMRNAPQEQRAKAAAVYLTAFKMYGASLFLPFLLINSETLSLTPLHTRNSMVDHETLMDALEARRKAQAEFDAYVAKGGWVHLHPKVRLWAIAALVGLTAGFCLAAYGTQDGPSIADIHQMLNRIK